MNVLTVDLRAGQKKHMFSGAAFYLKGTCGVFVAHIHSLLSFQMCHLGPPGD